MDASQDVTLLSFEVNQIAGGLETTVTFSRPLVTGDVDDDDLTVPRYLQYAYGDIINASLNLIDDPGNNRWISRQQISFDCSGVLQFLFCVAVTGSRILMECFVDHIYFFVGI